MPIGLGCALASALFLFMATNVSAQGERGEEVYSMADTARARVLVEEGKQMFKERKYDNSLYNAAEALKIYSQVLGQDTKEVADIRETMGIIYANQGKYADAAKTQEEVLKIRQSIFGEEHVDVASSYFRLGVVSSLLGAFPKALELGQKALKMRLKLLGDLHSEVAFSYNEVGAALLNLGEYQEGLANFQHSLQIRQKLFGEDHLDVATSNMNIGVSLNYLGEYDNALKKLRNCLKTRTKLLSENHPDNGACFNNMGLSYTYKGDYDRAIEHFTKALEVRSKVLGAEHPALRFSYNNLGICYSYKQDFEEAIHFATIEMNITAKVFGAESPAAIYSYINLGKIYFEMGQQDKAMEYAQKAVDLGIKALGEKQYLVGLAKGNLGNILATGGRVEEGIDLNMSSIAILTELLGETHPDVSSGYGALALNYSKAGKHSQADSLLTKMLIQLGDDGDENFRSAKSIPLILKALYFLAQIQRDWHEKSPSIKHLWNSNKNYQHALSALAYQSRNFSPTSKANLSTESGIISAGAIATNQLLHTLTDSLHYWQESFDYAERSKAYLLYESMKNADALHIAGIPDNLLEQEYNLRVEIAFHDKKRQEMLTNGMSDTDTTVLAISSKLFDLNRKHEDLIQLFENQYPEYYQAKYGLKSASLPEVQQSLAPNQTMLQYVVGDSSIFLFVVQKNFFEVQEIKKDFPLERWVDSLTRLGIYGYHTLPMDKRTSNLEATTVQNYTHTAQRLYEKLIAPVKAKLTPELIIIPDGVLGYVPFETLLSKAPGRKGVFASYPFLLREHRISYCYSATLLREMHNKKHRHMPEKSVLALAPFYRGNVETLNARVDTSELFALRDSLNTLNASGDEVAIIAKLLKGTPLYGAAASLDTFRQLAAQHRILHLSTHGKADDRVGDYAYLALGVPGNNKDYEKLYARDLYNLELNADLVVLSACETGIGKLRRGEGIVSLARAFAYAGAKSLVTSLWKVDDSKTKDLLVDFYKQLKAGKPKDEALQQAKLDFLTQNRKNGGTLMHPFYWAGFIAIGDMSPIR